MIIFLAAALCAAVGAVLWYVGQSNLCGFIDGAFVAFVGLGFVFSGVLITVISFIYFIAIGAL